MHGFFVYYILSSSEMGKNKKKSLKLKIRALIVAIIPCIMIAGSIVNQFNLEIGIAMGYTAWLWGVWVFLMINKTVTKGMATVSTQTDGSSNHVP